jgi:hypothetical protein
MHSQIILGLFMIPFNSNPMAHRKREKQKKKKRKERKRRRSYHRYSSPTQSGGRQATDGGTLDDSNSKAQRVRVQRFSISSFIRSTLYPDPGNSNIGSSSRKCDKTVVNARWAPHWISLMAAALTRPSASSTDEVSTTAKGGVSLGLPSTGPQTQVAKSRRASCSSHINQSRPATSSRHAAR